MKPSFKNGMFPILAAVALLVHTLLPFYAVYQLPAQPANASRMAALFGEKVLICTADGFRWVRWEDLLSGKEKPKQHKQYQCPVCYVTANGQGVAPTLAKTVPVAVPVVPGTIGYSVASRITAAEQEWQQRLTRSPPTFA